MSRRIREDISISLFGPKMITVALFLVLLYFLDQLGYSEAQLKFGFYSETCPSAESIVRDVVQHAVTNDPGKAAVLLRLQFHDCFVEGCDGSILIKHDGNDDERFAAGNAGVAGFDVIDEAKSELERLCPGIVSCADIVALAARDAIAEAKGPFYEVPTGRRDGRIANVGHATNLPDVQDSINTLKSKFREKGLSDQDLVLLSAGAHTIGTTACFFVIQRLDAQDPTINPEFFQILRSKCPQGGDVNVRIPLDWDSQFVFDDQILQNIKNGRGVILSDSVLYQDNSMKKIIDSYLETNQSSKANFAADFVKAMVKMGAIGVKIGVEGEIRRLCSATN
ncbi:hem peroxidase [Arabidopsis thaliana x Arabidopsis arenosa]|uniref:peroxidase n=1 Tax=Arabidopsis thaliana x Arabidopsis arenosa TaxID=1240361 RepID=A0A8T2BLR9_9BRAS|nr:hem peroxidase [Arabidopsis thaliana x Arabidopsis arenosa]